MCKTEMKSIHPSIIVVCFFPFIFKAVVYTDENEKRRKNGNQKDMQHGAVVDPSHPTCRFLTQKVDTDAMKKKRTNDKIRKGSV